MKGNLIVLALGGALYGANRLWLMEFAAAPFRWFFTGYLNDVSAGLVLCAVTGLLLACVGRKGPCRLIHTVPLLLAAGLFWELAGPLFRADAVLDWWDLLAYQAGGSIYLLLQWSGKEIFCPRSARKEE